MAIKLHRCPVKSARSAGHPCWKVEQALADAGIEYEVVKHTVLRWRRDEIGELAARIHAGRLGTTAGATEGALA